MVGMPFHSFVTGFTNEYSNLKRQERAHNSAMSIRELELGAQADADKQKNQSEYGGFMVDHIPYEVKKIVDKYVEFFYSEEESLIRFFDNILFLQSFLNDKGVNYLCFNLQFYYYS